MAGSRLTRSDMLRLFDLLNAELAAEDAQGELYLVGGARSRESRESATSEGLTRRWAASSSSRSIRSSCKAGQFSSGVPPCESSHAEYARNRGSRVHYVASYPSPT